jgi:hypothetical protein
MDAPIKTEKNERKFKNWGSVWMLQLNQRETLTVWMSRLQHERNAHKINNNNNCG